MIKGIDSKVFGGTMLVSGTSIGAAMLAMPITTGLLGFFATLVLLFGSWLFMYWVATLILEASLYFDKEISFYTMAKKTLGPVGAFVTWTTFLLLFYALIAAYLSGSGKIIIDGLEHLTGITLPPLWDILPLLILFAPFIYFGLKLVDQINRVLMYAMFLIFFIVIFSLMPSISWEYLSHRDLSFSMLSFSLIITGFGYHVLIPSLVAYLDRDIAKIKLCLFYGSLIPLVVYVLWELVMLGNLPIYGPLGLHDAFFGDLPISRLLTIHIENDWLAHLARTFAIFAVITSFLGVSQGLFDFWQDAISFTKIKQQRFISFILTFLPPVLFILFLQNGFIVLLEYAGALVAIVLGVIPILIVYKLRKSSVKTTYQAPGNYMSLFAGMLLFLFIVALVTWKNIFGGLGI